MNKITIDDFAKIEIKIGTILEATKVPDADRLLQLIFDFGTYQSEPSVDPVHPDGENEEHFEVLPELAEKYPGRDVRQIMSAIAPFVSDPSTLVGKKIAVCTNLEPRKFRGYVSQGMIMATDNEEGVVFLVPEKKVQPGAKIH